MFITVHTDREHKEFVAINVNHIAYIEGSRITDIDDDSKGIEVSCIQIAGSSKEILAYDSYNDVIRMIHNACGATTYVHIV